MAKLLRFLVVPASVLFWSIAGADEPPDFIVPEAVPLPDDELQQITVSLLERYPQLAGSPRSEIGECVLERSGQNGFGHRDLLPAYRTSRSQSGVSGRIVGGPTKARPGPATRS